MTTHLLSQIFAGIIATAAVILIAYYSSGLKKFIGALITAFIISIAIYGLLEILTQILMPYWLVPVLMAIATVVEVKRERTRERESEKMKYQSKE